MQQISTPSSNDTVISTAPTKDLPPKDEPHNDTTSLVETTAVKTEIQVDRPPLVASAVAPSTEVPVHPTVSVKSIIPTTDSATSTLSDPPALLHQSSVVPPSNLTSQEILRELESKLTLRILDVVTAERVLTRLFKDDVLKIFHKPVKVTPDIADYHVRIQRPMDLSSVRKRLLSGRYKTYAEYHNDLTLTFTNCIEYNGADHQFSVSAAALLDRARHYLLHHIKQWEATRYGFAGITLKKAQSLLAALRTHIYAADFSVPLDTLPLWADYQRRIPRPMDLTTIHNKILRNEYSALEQFISDVRAVFANCLVYWPQHDPICIKAHLLQNESELKLSEMIYALERGQTAKSKGKKRAVHSGGVKEEMPPTSPVPMTPTASSSDMSDPNELISQVYSDLPAKESVKAQAIVSAMLADPNNSAFMSPVDPLQFGDALADYFIRIARPMDLTTLRRKLDIDAYASAEALLADFSLIWTNVYDYYRNATNILDAPALIAAAQRLEAQFTSQWAEDGAYALSVQKNKKQKTQLIKSESPAAPLQPSSTLDASMTSTAVTPLVSSSTEEVRRRLKAERKEAKRLARLERQHSFNEEVIIDIVDPPLHALIGQSGVGIAQLNQLALQHSLTAQPRADYLPPPQPTTAPSKIPKLISKPALTAPQDAPLKNKAIRTIFKPFNAQQRRAAIATALTSIAPPIPLSSPDMHTQSKINTTEPQRYQLATQNVIDLPQTSSSAAVLMPLQIRFSVPHRSVIDIWNDADDDSQMDSVPPTPVRPRFATTSKQWDHRQQPSSTEPLGVERRRIPSTQLTPFVLDHLVITLPRQNTIDTSISCALHNTRTSAKRSRSATDVDHVTATALDTLHGLHHRILASPHLPHELASLRDAVGVMKWYGGFFAWTTAMAVHIVAIADSLVVNINGRTFLSSSFDNTAMTDVDSRERKRQRKLQEIQLAQSTALTNTERTIASVYAQFKQIEQNLTHTTLR